MREEQWERPQFCGSSRDKGKCKKIIVILNSSSAPQIIYSLTTWLLQAATVQGQESKSISGKCEDFMPEVAGTFEKSC